MAADLNQSFNDARDVLDFSGERILNVPVAITAGAERLPLRHIATPDELAEFPQHMDVNEEGARLQGLDYLMQMCPMQATQGGGTTAWRTQQAHFHQGAERFHDHRFLNGVVPKGVTLLLSDCRGVWVAPGGTFVSIRIDSRGGHQFSTLSGGLLDADDIDPMLRECLTTPGEFPRDRVPQLLDFLDTHREVPGLEFSTLTPQALARSSALLISSHTKDPQPTKDNENVMANQTRAIRHPEQFGSFLEWKPPAPTRFA
jgi:hypothetical protein